MIFPPGILPEGQHSIHHPPDPRTGRRWRGQRYIWGSPRQGYLDTEGHKINNKQMSSWVFRLNYIFLFSDPDLFVCQVIHRLTAAALKIKFKNRIKWFIIPGKPVFMNSNPGPGIEALISWSPLAAAAPDGAGGKAGRYPRWPLMAPGGASGKEGR